MMQLGLEAQRLLGFDPVIGCTPDEWVDHQLKIEQEKRRETDAKLAHRPWLNPTVDPDSGGAPLAAAHVDRPPPDIDPVTGRYSDAANQRIDQLKRDRDTAPTRPTVIRGRRSRTEDEEPK
jgi:hypothetical protein